jgi:hypothetical protein
MFGPEIAPRGTLPQRHHLLDFLRWFVTGRFAR